MNKAKLKLVKDGWSNVLTKLGIASKDKMLSTVVNWDRPVESELENIYSQVDVARRIVDTLPGEALREGIEFKAGEEVKQEVLDDFKKETENLFINQRFKKAWSWARLYGGSAIFLAVDDGEDISKPLDVKNIKQLKSLTVLNSFEMQPKEIETDLNSPMFGMPVVYSLSTKEASKQQSQEVHHTRLIRFDGAELPRLKFIENNRWHDSILTAMWEPIRDYNSAHSSVARMVQDFSMTVLKLKDLADLLQDTGGRTKLTERLELINLSKSILATMVIDAEDESIESLSQTVTGVDKLLDKVTNRLVVSAGIPATILLGKSPTGGLSGKGESENRDWYDQVAHQRELVLRPRLKMVFTIMQLAKKGSTNGKKIEGFDWCFKPLWQMDDKEKAAIRKSQAEADKIYIENGVVDPIEIARSRFGGEFTLETTIDFKERERIENQTKVEPDPDDDDDEEVKGEA